MPAIQIDVVSDVICPWCFLGKRRLDKAMALVPEYTIDVMFRPFFLDPTIPAEGIPRETYMLNKFGAERLKTIHDPLVAAGKEDGIAYAFEQIKRTPNTMNAHRLLRWALEAGKQPAVVEDLFAAYWLQGRDIGDAAVLLEIAQGNGMDGKSVAADLATNKDGLSILAEVEMAQKMGVSGVPAFIMAKKYLVVGAQSADVLADAIRKVAA